MVKLEIKIKDFIEENNPGFKKMIYVGRYCRKYIAHSLNIKSNTKTEGCIKIEGENFKTNYKVEIGVIHMKIGYLQIDYKNSKKFIKKFSKYDKPYLFVGNMTHNSSGYIDTTIIDRLIKFNESLAKHLHLKNIRADPMYGATFKREVEAYDQRGYELLDCFGMRGRELTE